MARFYERFLPKAWRSSDLTIPVVRLSGAIMAGGGPLRPTLSLASVAPVLERAFAYKESPVVALIINSPGGSPVQSNLIYQRIRSLAKEKNKKVIAFAEDAAASGGYMIACAADEIFVDPSSIVGSIGVVSSSFGFVEALKKLGVERRLHTAGQNKAILDPFKPENEADVARLKQLQLEIHDVFINLVKASRGTRLADDPDLFTGAFWTGAKAVSLGLADGLGDMRQTLKARFGEKTGFKLVTAPRGFLGRSAGLGAGMAGEMAAAAAGGFADAAEERVLWARFGL